MDRLAVEIYDSISDMDYMDYLDGKEIDLDNLLQDLEVLEQQGNGSLLEVVKILIEG